MAGSTEPRRGRLRYLWRRYARREVSPLARRPAAAERLAASVLLVLLLLSAAATCLAAVGIHAAASRDARRARSAASPVTATVLGPQEAGTGTAVDLGGPPVGHTVRLRWQWHGREHMASETLYEDLAPGTATTAWVDAAGRLTSPPWRGSDVVVIPAGVALGGALLTLALAWAAARSYQAWTLRRRARLWDEEWSQVGPLWTRRQGLR